MHEPKIICDNKSKSIFLVFDKCNENGWVTHSFITIALEHFRIDTVSNRGEQMKVNNGHSKSERRLGDRARKGKGGGNEW